MKVKVDDIILAPLAHQNYQPCKVKRILAKQKYQVLFLQQNTSAIVLGQSIRPYAHQQQSALPINQALQGEEKDYQPTHLQGIGPASDKLKQEENPGNTDGSSQSKVDRLRMKKSEKQEEIRRQARPISSQKSKFVSSRGQNSCSTLRLLLQKLGNEVSKSFRSSQELISEYEIQRLKTILDLNYPLSIYDIAKEWIVEAFILLIKEIKLWGIPSYPQLEHMTQDKFQQIKDFILSEGFEGVDLPQSKKKRIILKVKQNQLQVNL